MVTNKEQNKLNVPHLRFPEFHGEWEKHGLSEYLDFKNGLNPDSKRFGKGIKFISVMDILNNPVITYDCIRASVQATDAEISSFSVENGDILFQRSSETLEDVGRANVYIDDRVAVFGGFVIRGKKKANYNPLFFRYLLSSPYARKRIIPMGAGAQHFNIGQEGLSKVLLNFPSIEEQTKIASLLHLLDERIATQSKLIEDLKKLKSAIIENVFDDKHSERLQLDNVGSYIRGLTYSSNDVVEHGGTLVMRSNNIVNGSLLDYNNNVVFVNKQMSAEQQLQNGDIVICMANGSSSLVGKSSFYDGNWHSPITVGAFCGIYRSKEPIVKWLFQTNKYRRYIWNSLQGGNGAIANLNGEDILNMSFSIPNAPIKDTCVKMLTSVDSALENNISLCALYTLQKQHLLRQMFI
jgi:restriction endonuclease S subunit